MKKQQALVKIKACAEHEWFYVAPGVWGLRDRIVNVYFIHDPSTNHWILVDAGMAGAAARIRRVARELFWPQATPAAIVLTHGHFDHVGAVMELADEWDVPVYAHYLEAPYLTGRSAYPPPDPTAGGGLFTWFSFLFPKGPVDLGGRLLMLPEQGNVPGLKEWKYIHTPGHAPGHISLYREQDGVLIAGDAFVTTKQESVLAVLKQQRTISGPPRYFTYDWKAAEKSVQTLASLQPAIVATGHGHPLEGESLAALQELADNFREKAVPVNGRYTEDPAVAGISGVEYVPPAKIRKPLLKAVAVLAVIGIGALLASEVKKRYT
ncbi:MBL fold metallo-hydrolase [Chitinophaga rhizophila]|uniref:MBL fold metallo-hydrolase n=1 Tax=Chitinophaga rhizophila TaxID=2866212 RepID=A0ABS7G8J6_9BACT|nr:MBL fold metallo-hydrolase [Chitinophaga rhizophila]MBW8683716.1 MBL fold metallo-hydrolase [Chitinophaga rhizophila]